MYRTTSPGAATESAVSLLKGGAIKDDYDGGGKGYDERGNQKRRGAARKN